MTEKLLQSIADNSILGTLLVLSFVVIFFLYKDSKKEREDRLEDMRDVWQNDVKYRSELKSLIQNILDILRGGKQ